jgi:signal peptidase I
MSPTLLPGERILATPLLFGPRTLFGKLPPPARPARGDLVLLDPPYAEAPAFLPALGDSLLRFFSAQRLSILPRGPLSGPGVERVIGLPGDTLVMEDFIFKVRPADREYFLTEFELSGADYDISTPSLPEGWKADYPLSGSMAPLTLGRNEYFVAGDDRASSADSRHWGPVRLERFRAKVLLRYWPLRRFGLP